MLADLDARDVGRDWLEFASDFNRGFGLQIVHVDVAWSASQPEQNHRFASRDLAGFATAGFAAQHLRKCQPAGCQTANLQKTPAGNTVARPERATHQLEH